MAKVERKLHTKINDAKYNEYHAKTMRDMKDPVILHQKQMERWIAKHTPHPVDAIIRGNTIEVKVTVPMPRFKITIDPATIKATEKLKEEFNSALPKDGFRVPIFTDEEAQERDNE